MQEVPQNVELCGCSLNLNEGFRNSAFSSIKVDRIQPVFRCHWRDCLQEDKRVYQDERQPAFQHAQESSGRNSACRCMVLQLVLGCLRRRKLPQQAPSFVLVHVLEMLVDILLIVALTFPTHVLEMQMVILTSVAIAFLTAPYFLIRNSGNQILRRVWISDRRI